jgi:hypothetical protein
LEDFVNQQSNIDGENGSLNQTSTSKTSKSKKSKERALTIAEKILKKTKNNRSKYAGQSVISQKEK